MKKKLFKQILVAFTVLFATGIYAQNVTGLVTSDDGPLPGATVLVQGTNNFASTDFDGNFSVEAAQGDILIVSFVGYQTQEVAVDGDQLTINLALGNLLQEVIVTTGYGTQSKRDITGAVSTIDAEELTSVPATTFAQQMQGRASGISVVSDATPGGEATVRIRGFGTTGNNNPLYVIDGVPTESQGNLNPQDIESFQILKDASAASIYGSRAANGVIIITTKRGKVGASKISYSSYMGWQTAANDVDALDARGLGEYLYLADYYAGKTPSHGQYGFSGTPENPQISIPNYVFPSGAASVDESLYSLTESNIYAITKSADTNWWELMTQDNAPISQHSIDASGATETSQYAFNATFFSQDAVIKYQGYKRATIRLNSSTKTLGDRLEIGENFTLSLDNRFGGFGNDGEQNAVSGAYKHHPLLPNYDIAGNFAGSRGLNLGNNYNPYASQSRNQDDRTRRSRAFGNVYAQLTIAKDFKFKSSFGINLTTGQRKNIGRPQPEYVEGNFINSQESATNWDYEWTWTNTLSWAKVLNDVHDVSAYVGVEAIQGFGEYFGASRQRFPFQSTNIISYLDLGNQGTAGNFGNISKDFSLWSQFVQANYQYDGKYLAQVTVRNDASSRFKSATNSAVFPAFSLGWRMSEEDFMSGISFIDDLKFRYGWGKTGNQSIGDYNAYTQFRSSSYNSGYPIDGSNSSATLGYDPSQFGNPNAKWEATVSNNFGFDATLFDRAVSVEFDLWNRTTSDLLLTVPVVYSAGDAGAPAVNVGEMYNEGIDFAIDWTKDLGELQLTLGGNISSYRNEVKKLDEFDTPIFGSNRRVPALTRTAVGDPISSIYGFEVLGIFQSQSEADAWAPYGTTGYNAPGKFKYADINNDGEINDDDRTIIGNPHPDFVYGINLNLAYRNFNLNIFGNGVQGNDVYNYVRYFADFNTFQGNRSTRALTEAWQPSNPSAPRAQWTAANPNATSPIMDANDQISSRTSSYLIEDASYFRLRNIQLTYSFDDAINTALGISGGQIYLQGQNLFTITNYSGLNPEIQTGNDIQLGYDGGFMPVSKTLIVGLNISLF
ncbi:MAG: TonB-dependent receptor [Flavobacteriaceae bacterium]|nr:TonB-dependent receptor [Flavobacteriaceae bacterium]MDG1912781.1 TonB-dependent receptor [Flavobacteriaceae bacterium]